MGVEIRTDRERLLRNLKTLKEKAKGKLVCAVVKANAYGHGANMVSLTLQNEVNYFAVATAGEGIKLRKIGIKKPILLLSFKIQDAELCVKNDLTPSVFMSSQIKALKKYAKEYHKTPCIHLKVDTGMNRFGVKTIEQMNEILDDAQNIVVSGVYTHFYSAESVDTQTERFLPFEKIVKEYNENSISHLSATTAIVKGKTYGDMVRIGIGLYGYSSQDLLPVMQVKSRVLAIKKLKVDEIAGYNGIYAPNKESFVAIIDGGYADGVFRSFAGKVSVLCNGQFLPVVAVCMDSFIVKLDNAQISVGDEVILIGESANKSINADYIAREIGTIPYEILTSFGNLARS